MQYKNIIFDLGNVLVKLDMEGCIGAFKKQILWIAIATTLILPLGMRSCPIFASTLSVQERAVEKQTADYKPGDIVPSSVVKTVGEDKFFSSSQIPDAIFKLMQGKTYKKNCTVPRSELRYLRCLHVDAKGNVIVGEMVVNKAIAKDVLDIFRKLYEAKYPIERMRLIDYWDADDERAMRDNNSSSFNFRLVSHTKTVSKHGKGMAVDINTLYNPYHKCLKNGREVIEPATGKPYLNRKKPHPYMIQRGDLCYRLFKEKGFRWGGDWKTMKDYQHFEK